MKVNVLIDTIITKQSYYFKTHNVGGYIVEGNYYLKICERIKELRLKRNMTKTQLAKGICSISYITRIENGERCPTSVILRQLANKLGISSDYLLRIVESPTSLRVKKMLDLIFLYYERHDPSSIYKLITDNEEIMEQASTYDKQIIKTFKCMCTTYLIDDYEQGLKELKGIIDITYTEGSIPNDIEFLQLFFYSIFLYHNNRIDESYESLIRLQKYIKRIECFYCYAIIPDYYTTLVNACLELSKFDACYGYLEIAINYCKQHNVHALLRQLYFLKSELYVQLGREDEAKQWLDNATTLDRLISTDSDCMFEDIK